MNDQDGQTVWTSIKSVGDGEVMELSAPIPDPEPKSDPWDVTPGGLRSGS